MNKKTLALIGLTTLLATAATFLLAAGPKDQTDGKFHLVFLAAAVDLKPGSKVTVDPIFITDGRTVRNFHDFCRKIGESLRPDQIAVDRQFIENYCGRKPIALEPRGYHIINNHGQKISLSTVEFKVIGEVVIPPNVERQSESDFKDSVMMGNAKIKTYQPGLIEPPKWLRNDGAPEYFFLMSSDKQVLERIVPVSQATSAEVVALTRRANEFSKIAKWRMAGTPTYLKDVEKVKPGLCRGVKSPFVFRMENPLITDLDADGKPDMYVNVYTTVRLEQEPDMPLVDCFTAYRINGSGDAILSGNTSWPQTTWARSSWRGGMYQRYLQNNYPVHTNLIAIRVAEQNRVCTYVLQYYTGELDLQFPQGYAMSSFDCREHYVFSKHIPPYSNRPYHTQNLKNRNAINKYHMTQM
jgi:hypothetical protein